MDADSEVERIFRHESEDEEEEKKKHMRPPSSYGSMKSESDMETEEEEGGVREQIPVALPEPASHDGTGIHMNRSASPETLYTITTQQTKPPGAAVFDTRSEDLDIYPEEEEEEEDLDELLITNSPEPPEPVEPDDYMQTDENGQPGRLHPEQDLPHIFKSIQSILTDLTKEELFKFKMWFYQWEPGITLQQVMDGDLLDFVDKILEVLEQDRALMHTISTLENVNKKEEAEKLQNGCQRLLMRYHLKQYFIRKYQVIREGVVRAGRQNLLETVFVEPNISTCPYGGVDPSHEFRQECPTPLQVPGADTYVGVNNLFRLKKDDGSLVRTVVTTGIPGIGRSVVVGKFCLDWAELKANRDLQFVIRLSFQAFWTLRSKPPMSIMEVIEYYQPECKDMKYLEEEDCKFLIVMDSFDCYQDALDWEKAPVINDNNTKADTSTLIVNIIRGTVLRGARVWILGRAAAVSQIPSQFIDKVTEIQGFSSEMVDDYITRRYDAELAQDIKTHYKRLPSLQILARNPFVCWMVATVFERCYRYVDYGNVPPRLTPFYVNIVIVQTNRKLEFYYDKNENDLNWSDEDKNLLIKMGKMAFKMLERNVGVFYEDDVKEQGLKLTEVTILSGLCTELPASASEKRRTFCFLHFSLQEFMAALYVFTMFRTEGKNVLDSGGLQMPKFLTSKNQSKSGLTGVIQCALTRTFKSALGYYDLFLRFLCGMLSTDCHDDQLRGYLYRQNAPKVGGLDEAQRLLEQTIEKAPADRVANLKECLREMIQVDE
ncbi:protein NLRC3 [Betta splendens]|uniref:Protein NLRC3 n=1 Tax=Betta splendens TaxID=158456 RepID=A0A6P7P7S9_BETSP|nr:protein NLRC3 [Betta splendens]XP_055370250.1 protein NLRC3 [Betta splendens]